MPMNKSVAAFVIVVVIVSAALGAASFNVRAPPSYTSSTITTTNTIFCPSVNSTQTPSNSTVRLPNFGPLLGNFSGISVVESVQSSQGNFAALASLQVLNISYSGSRPVYLVNVTMVGVSSNVTMVNIINGFTTTSTTSGNQTEVGSVVGTVASNGSLISVDKSTGVAAITNQLTLFPLGFFETLTPVNSTSPNYVLRASNSAVVTIGSTRMLVTNFELPTVVLVQFVEGCGSGTSTVSTAGTVTNVTIQEGRVPGTNFKLVTQFSETIILGSNSSSTSKFPPTSISEKVTSFSVG